MWRPLWDALEFLTLRLVLIEPPTNCQLQFRFFHPDNDSYRCFLRVGRSALESYNSLYPLVFPLQFQGQQFVLWLHFSDKSNICWFFSLLSLLLISMEWQLLRSLHVEYGTRSPSIRISFFKSLSLANWKITSWYFKQSGGNGKERAAIKL